MKSSSLGKILGIILTFCGAMVINSSAQTLTTLVRFDGTNGSAPAASLIQASDGNLYGTTEYGGPIDGCEGGFNPCGTVFKITLSGTLTTLHTFVYSDGAFPVSPVVQGRDGNFYGTNQGEGDSGGAGAIFKMTPGGTVTVLSSTSSVAGLVQGRDGNFYGTTPRSYTNGTVFKITASGTLTTLHTFNGTDGNNPQAGLIQATDGNFYGTTYSGGTSSFCGGGCGTVFKVTPSGSLTTLHSFSGTDGYNVYAGLVEGADGNFYGTTFNGGAHNVGEVYKITPSGTLTVLHTFDGTDGAYPRAAPVRATDGHFYGTTFQGGAYGQGTVFAITPSGLLTTLYSFCPHSGCADGANPVGGVIQARDGNFYGTTTAGGNNGSGTVFKLQLPITLTVSVAGSGSVTSTDGSINCPGTCTHVYQPNTQVTLNAAAAQNWAFSGWTGACMGVGTCTLTMTQNLYLTGVFVEPGFGLQFTPVTPCRVVDTRNNGGHPIPGGSAQSFIVPQLWGCGIPTSAAAYSLNVTAVPHGGLGYLTIWPAGEAQPVVSTMNSPDGRVKANAAIVPAGAQGAVSVFVTDTADVILDINGYFAAPGSQTYQFYPLAPCRVLDTRGGHNEGTLQKGVERDYTIAGQCNIPSTATAYSFNITVVPNHGELDYLTVWPKGVSMPLVSTLNDGKGTIVANAAIVPAGTSRATAFYAHDNSTDLIVDVNGYFATAATGGLSLYQVAPCRVLDTRSVGSGHPFTGEWNPPNGVGVVTSPCAPPISAKAFVFNATVVPPGPMLYLTLWPHGESQPNVSTLNAADGSITSNMAIVPTNDGSIEAYAAALTHLILDISGYFAP